MTIISLALSKKWSARWPPNKLSIAKSGITCQHLFVHSHSFLRFARANLVDFIQHSNLKFKISCAKLLAQRGETKWWFSKWLQAKQKALHADNVKARVLHVMNMNHTKRKLSTCSKKRDCKQQTMDASIFEYTKNMTNAQKFWEDEWNLKNQKDSKAETSKRLTKHHEPKKTEP